MNSQVQNQSLGRAAYRTSDGRHQASTTIERILCGLRHPALTVYDDARVFGSWLAGLWEGDGHVNRKPKPGFKPTLGFTFGLNQRPLVEALANYFERVCAPERRCRGKRGSIKITSITVHGSRNVLTWTLLDISALKHFLDLTEGQLRTPKAYGLNHLIAYINRQARLCNGRLYDDAEPSTKSVLRDAWLSGFSEADGSFGLRQTRSGGSDGRRRRQLTECTYTLPQRVINEHNGLSVRPLFDRIGRELHATVVDRTRVRTRGKPQVLVKASSARSKAVLRRYFECYPLLSSKRHDYDAWARADDVMRSGLHYTACGSCAIAELRRSMNQKRSNFTWAHLTAFNPGGRT